MTLQAARRFVKTHGVVLESGGGPIPSLADTVAGEHIRGSWWGHPKGHEIFALSRALRDWPDVVVCRVVRGNVTYVHRRLWPALVRLAARFDAARLAALREVHTATGRHQVETVPFPRWVPADVREAARLLTEGDAARMLGDWVQAALTRSSSKQPDSPVKSAKARQTIGKKPRSATRRRSESRGA